MYRTDKIVFENQNNFRVLNQIRLVAELQKGPQTFANLAERLDLSITAIVKIVKELRRNGLVKLTSAGPSIQKKAGRRPTFVSLDTSVGLVAAIDFSSRDLLIALSELNSKVLVQDVIEDQNIINADTIALVVEKLKGLLASKEAGGRPLVGICISSPGKMDPEGNYIFVHRIEDYQHVNLKRSFSEIFHVDVDVYHDVNLGCVGERVFGSIPKEARNILFAYIDNEAGSSLFLNGRLYGGSHGLAGEVNDIKPIDEVSRSSNQGQFSTLEDIRNDIHEQLKNVPSHPLKDQPHYRVKTMVKLYEEGDPYVSAALERNAQQNALLLLGMTNLLDVDYLVI